MTPNDIQNLIDELKKINDYIVECSKFKCGEYRRGLNFAINYINEEVELLHKERFNLICERMEEVWKKIESSGHG